MAYPFLTVIGGGQMARALIGGMLASGLVPESSVCVIDRNALCRDWWTESHAGVTIAETVADAPPHSEVTLLAVKPHHIVDVCEKSRPFLAPQTIVSVAAGISLATLTTAVGHGRVVRVMPNTPSFVRCGASGFCLGPAATPSDKHHVESMLRSVGICFEVTETQLDAVTGVSGSGPAYVFLIIEAMADGGVAAGLPRATALALATQTVLGAATMVQQTGSHPAILRDNVCSPGGTTIAAVAALEQNGVRGGLIAAVNAAAKRSRELGK